MTASEPYFVLHGSISMSSAKDGTLGKFALPSLGLTGGVRISGLNWSFGVSHGVDDDLTGPQRFALSLFGAIGLTCVALGWRTYQRERLKSESVLAQFGGIPGCEARFTGGLPPTSSNDAVRRTRIPVDLRHRIEREAATNPSPRSLADWAILCLLSGKQDSAVSLLKAAVDKHPHIPALLNDLGAAYFARYDVKRDPQDLILGLSAIEEALALNPHLPEGLFNRALVLDRLFLVTTAVQAWQRYMDADQSDWKRVAQKHLQGLDIEFEATAWDRDRHAMEMLPTNESAESIHVLASRFRQRSRLYIEQDLMGRWAAAYLEGHSTEAQDVLTRVHIFAVALAEFEGDGMLADAAEAIDRALNPAHLLALAQGHAAFSHGMALFSEARDADALQQFQLASTRLSQGGSPFHLWADFRISYCLQYQGHYDDALEHLNRILKDPSRDRYPNLLGRAQTVIGIVHLKLGDLSTSLYQYELAKGWFEKTGEGEYVASVDYMMAENLRYQGETGRAWSYRYGALAATYRLGSSIYYHNTLYDSAEAALKQGLPGVALAFQDEMIAYDRRQRDNLLFVADLVRRSRVRFRQEDVIGSRRDLEKARRALKSIPKEQRRSILEADLAMIAGEVEATNDPKAAIQFLDTAIGFAETRKDSFRLPGLYLQRALAALHLGDRAAAEHDLSSSIVEGESQREKVLEDQLRVQYADQVQAAFDEMIRLQVSLGNYEQAFDFAERGRTRNLLETLDEKGGARIAVRSFTAQEIRAVLPADVVLVEYALLADQVLAWVLTRNGLALIPIPVRRPALEEEIGRFCRELQGQGTRQEADRLAAKLHGLLIRPIQRELVGAHTLVIVPDRALHLLPFSVLLDARRSRYLIEDVAVAIAPSANLYVRAARRSGELKRQGNGRTLIVSDPAFEQSQFPTFVRLRGAMEEGRAIAGLSRNSKLLTGASATKAAVLRDAAESGVVHLAAHARVNTEYPLLSVFPLAPDAGRIGSGALYAYEIYHIPFRRTRLVVLAACDSGVGALSESEGVVSLARPFLAAGVPAVVASLWRVDDRSTAVLFRAFHRNMSAGQNPLLAFRHAQLAQFDRYRNEARRQSSWSAFQFIGGSE